uniref:Uncharacterized protein n=1 Tax=Gopherus agassizii TaxID=38772 RepID=A0A452J2S7_9SAUR
MDSAPSHILAALLREVVLDFSSAHQSQTRALICFFSLQFVLKNYGENPENYNEELKKLEVLRQLHGLQQACSPPMPPASVPAEGWGDWLGSLSGACSVLESE